MVKNKNNVKTPAIKEGVSLLRVSQVHILNHIELIKTTSNNRRAIRFCFIKI